MADSKLKALSPLFEYVSAQAGGAPVLAGGKVASAFSILVSGQVQLPPSAGGGRPLLLVAGGDEAREHGQWFGGRSLLHGTPMSGPVVACAPSLLLCLNVRCFKQLMHIAPEIESALVVRE